MQKLLTYPSTERPTALSSDKVLVGLLTLCENIFSSFSTLKRNAVSNSFGKEAFKQLLFPPSKDYSHYIYDHSKKKEIGVHEPPKCKTKESRAKAYRLLETISFSNG